MSMNLLLYVIPLSLTVVWALITTYYIWRRGGAEAIISIIILLAGASWVFAYIMEIVMPILEVKVFWNQMQYIGSSILIPGLLILSLQSIGYDRWVTRRNILLVIIVPVISLGFIFTNQWHGLFWPSHTMISYRGILWLDHPHGPVYYIYVYYSYVIVVGTGFLLLYTIFSPRRSYRRQALMIFLGILLPFVANVINWDILYPLNLTQMAFSVAVIPLTWGLVRLQIGDVLPVAHKAIFEGMNDGVIVLDGQGQIIDANAAAAMMLACSERELRRRLIETVWDDGRFLKNIGQPAAHTWLRPQGRLFQPEKISVVGREAVFERDGQQKIYDVRISPIVDWRDYIISQVVVFRDVTQRVQAERLVKKANEDLEGVVTERTNELRQANQKLQHELTERKQAEMALKQAHDELEQRVTERTAELAQINDQLTFELVERKRAEEKIQISLREKDVLLKEIHHRVKNNLQVISSMLSLQSGYLDDEAVLTIFQDSKNRVRSMALIHEKLYQSDNLALVDFGDYCENLAMYLVRFYNKGQVQLKVDAEPVYLGIDTAVPCGLILNELVSNALKHAFPDGCNGQIAISLQKETKNQVIMSIVDNGVGLPPDLEVFNTPSLGLQLVRALVEQLGGDWQIHRTNGRRFDIKCPVKEST